MADSRFSFEGLIAKNAPEARDAPVVKRGKYDFAVAYPDPASLPIDGLLDGLREAMEQEGADLALYAHQSGYAPLREFVAQKLAR
ncbi:MAG: PLP-dependent aminotransferase family protein, partial [Chloroflexi bacterium]|nr:PLP-dependent aminotransferase family protein [Chloroflexota bacterium]